jgi:hypothetical protein
VLLPAIDDSATHVFFRVNNHEYYLATFAKGKVPGGQLTFKRLAPAELVDGSLGAELLTVYTGSLHANNIVRIHGLESVQRAMQTMEQIAIPIGTTASPANHLKWLKVDTSPGEALMFDHSTRMIVTRLPEGAVTWAQQGSAGSLAAENRRDFRHVVPVTDDQPGQQQRSTAYRQCHAETAQPVACA